MELELFLKAKHFKNTTFQTGDSIENGCAIEKAVFDQIKPKQVMSRVENTFVDGINFIHEFYGSLEFENDVRIAEGLNFSDEVVRILKLKKDE